MEMVREFVDIRNFSLTDKEEYSTNTHMGKIKGEKQTYKKNIGRFDLLFIANFKVGVKLLGFNDEPPYRFVIKSPFQIDDVKVYKRNFIQKTLFCIFGKGGIGRSYNIKSRKKKRIKTLLSSPKWIEVFQSNNLSIIGSGKMGLSIIPYSRICSTNQLDLLYELAVDLIELIESSYGEVGYVSNV